jgi:hypothetical protein
MAEEATLSQLRKEQKSNSVSSQFHKKTPWLFNWKSLFYFFWFVFFLGALWMGYSLINNSMTQLYGWDYTWQYIEFAYDYWDTWRGFFKTGYFQLYSTDTFLGGDNIGSNSYYGLFDPFLFICYIFPRAWVPQTFATATIIKVSVSALLMRAYLKYMGCQETTSRLGAVAYAFCGYVNFFVGYPSFVTVSAFLPLVLLGIEKVIKERKTSCLVWGLFFLGVSSFFFLVVVSIWGVIYALWRFFWTLKSRKAKENWLVVAVGIGAFAVGILMSAWTLFPSLRQSTLSGRTTSIGSLYLAQLKNSLKNFDLKTFFGLLFSEVGGNNAREIQPLTGFFFPTVNYLWSPLMTGTTSNHYDSWTSSLYVYTPFLILFFTALVSSIRRKQVSHLVAFALCCYLLFTNFAYFFFYAFTGDGYGRWYIVLIPIIIYYAGQELDRLKDEPKWVLPTGSMVSLFLTILTWVLTVVLVKNQTFSSNGFTYVQPGYYVPGYVEENGVIYSCLWVVYFQIALVLAEGIVMFYFQHKKYFWAILLGLVSVEVVIWGNCSFAYGSSWSFKNNLDGGVETSQTLTNDFAKINSEDSSYYRSYLDTQNSVNAQSHYDFNGTSTFHSLYNFDVAQLARYSHMTSNYTYDKTAYSGVYHDVSWTAYYGNKRFGADTALGMKYYVIEKDPYSGTDWNNVADNVPFGSELVQGERNKDSYLVYRNTNIGDATTSMVGHAVDSTYLYKAGTGSYINEDTFYTNGGGHSTTSDYEIIRNEGLYLNGAIIKNDDVTALEDSGFTVNEGLPNYTTVSGMQPVSFLGKKVTTDYGYFTNEEGPAAFLTNSKRVTKTEDFNPSTYYNPSMTYLSDFDKVVFYPKSGWGQAFNTDPNGAYFLMSYLGAHTRVYMIGDTVENGVTKTDQLLCYEYKMIRNYNWYGGNGDQGGNALFGFYPRGIVRYIVLCSMPSDYGVTTTLPNFIRFYMMERSAYDAQLQTIKDNALKNVNHWTDNFTCTSDYSEKKLVVTSIAYDAGWRVYATDAAGKTTQLPTYKLDGGFVGFVAPAGETSYHLFFQTKYLKEGALLAMAGFGMYALYEVIMFVRETKREHRALGITIERKPFEFFFKKKSEDASSSPHKPNAP